MYNKEHIKINSDDIIIFVIRVCLNFRHISAYLPHQDSVGSYVKHQDNLDLVSSF